MAGGRSLIPCRYRGAAVIGFADVTMAAELARPSRWLCVAPQTRPPRPLTPRCGSWSGERTGWADKPGGRALRTAGRKTGAIQSWAPSRPVPAEFGKTQCRAPGRAARRRDDRASSTRRRSSWIGTKQGTSSRRRPFRRSPRTVRPSRSMSSFHSSVKRPPRSRPVCVAISRPGAVRDHAAGRTLEPARRAARAASFPSRQSRLAGAGSPATMVACATKRCPTLSTATPNPSSVRTPRRIMSPGSANTTSSAVSYPSAARIA